MSIEFSRVKRISEILMREIARIIQFKMSDPRIGMITVSHVDVTSDLKCAKVFITRLNDFNADHNIQECLKCMANAEGFLRRNLAKRTELRIIPELLFLYDYSLEHGFYIDNLIFKANNITDD
ncbi:MAG: 30S ribosome-binding factor RbfA [Piscirickettsiaceae bacterium]|nr:30S ribosome-binding factor RbfA [Piscirickettsiaceae bacterium]